MNNLGIAWSENQQVHIEKITDYQIRLDDDELNEEHTLDDNGHDIEGDDCYGDDYVEMKVAPKKMLIAK